ncbi:MAG: allantoate amidohydrolase [Actinomycetota bacterium]|nr:allantoate amidohydrolase [Actinomycetota bacterium]
MLDEIADIGRDAHTGGYRRYAWSDADMALREWFVSSAETRGLDVHEDGNGNQYAWRGSSQQGNALMIGSHLDSVPDGGAYDGPLGVVSSFEALDQLGDFEPSRPIVIANFADEEGARFGIACAGSQLLTGVLDADKALGLRDCDGITMAEALTSRGRDPRALGSDLGLLAKIGTFVELHVEQGKSLIDSGDAVGVASAIWPHGRFRFDFCGEANHAGATAMADRRDPMIAYAATVLAAQRLATESGARATFGKLRVEPGGTNAIPSRITAWLDARASGEANLDKLVDDLVAAAKEASAQTDVEMTTESLSPAVEFDIPLRDGLAKLLDAPVLPTGAGHDAGVLSEHLPTAMLFIRNPTGISHSPEEFAEDADCKAGVDALADVIRALA